ncbi:fusaric acid resistance domain protein [Klebsiella pneumoniae]|uniref:Fusaric acid resistance domain protein n=1 Tax=Klebsiella pneumoniae TaxID=573 RepID=A0A2X1QY51_KLEPN|nr:fusaric acid resistance domain protein [Klebsiella pneumoniae]
MLLNCSHVVWQLREWETRSDPLAQVRDLCINLLRDVMSERGVQQRPLASTLQELQRICDALNHHHQPAARGTGRRDLATVLRPVAAGTGPGGRHNWRRNYLITPQGKPFAAAAQRLRTVGHVIPAYVDHQRFPFHPPPAFSGAEQ